MRWLGVPDQREKGRMTIEEFNATGWKPGMMAEYHGETFRIASCDFEEKLVGLIGLIRNEPDEISWVRCENITMTPNSSRQTPTASGGSLDGVVGRSTGLEKGNANG